MNPPTSNTSANESETRKYSIFDPTIAATSLSTSQRQHQTVLETEFPLLRNQSPRSFSRERTAYARSSFLNSGTSTGTRNSTSGWTYQSSNQPFNTSLGRNGSLRKAYDEQPQSAQQVDGNDTLDSDNQPLFQQQTQKVTVSSASYAQISRNKKHSSGTSDYHTDSQASSPAKSPTSEEYATLLGRAQGVSENQNATSGGDRRSSTLQRNSSSRQGTMRSTRSRRHRKAAEDPNAMGGCTRCSFGFLVLLAQILLNGAMGLCLYWIVMFHANEQGQIFAWADGDNPAQVFNLHPVLMVAGFIYFMGQAMLMYRTCRCCRRIWNKLLHTVFHILAIPCIILGFIAVFDSHKLKDIPHFYSLHSWIGLTAMGLFAMQFIIGFFSFLLLLCCEKATASFRAALVPVHATFGLSTFVVAVAAACSGLTEKVFFTLSLAYSKWVPYFTENGFESEGALENLSTLGPNYRLDYAVQALVINCLGACLILLAIVIPCILGVPNFRYRSAQRIITVTQEHYS